MLDISLPPYDADAALRMGDNSRAVEIQQVAKELSEAKIAYLKMATQGEICQRLKVLHVAFVSGMSDAEFRVLWGYLMHGNRDGNGITIGQTRLGLLIDKSERAVRRATKDLEDGGWLDAKKHQRKDASRSAVIPNRMMNAILFEIVERTNMSGQRIEVPKLTAPQPVDRTNTVDRTEPSAQVDRTNTVDRTEPSAQAVALTGQKRDFRPDESGDITIIDNHRVVILAPERASDDETLDEADFENYHEVFHAWGIKPAQREIDRKSGFDWPRSRTDATLIGALKAQVSAGRSVGMVLLAARNTLLSMQTRIALQDDQPGGRRGVQSYFQKEFDGNVRFLLRQETEQKATAIQTMPRALAPPVQKHWRDQKREDSEDTRNVVKKLAAELRSQKP